jgi:predicted DNA-binding transcriptional regulator AlpA
MELSVTLPRLVDEGEAAKFLGKSVAWMQRARSVGQGPRFAKLGHHVRYRAEDLDAYVRANMVDPVGAAA